MHTIEIPDRKQKIEFASCIEEMRSADFKYMMQLVLMHINDEITIDDFKTMLLFRLLKIKKTYAFYRMQREKKDILLDNIRQISAVLDSFFITEVKDGKEVLSLNLNFLKNMVPRIGRFMGPMDALTNCTFYEYKQAFIEFQHYNEYNDEEALNSLIAILYRPRIRFYFFRKFLPRFSGDIRQKFTPDVNPLLLESRKKKISRMPAHIKLAVYLFFNSCVKYLRDGKPVIDGVEIDLSVLYAGESSGGPGIGLQGILFSLSESKVFGDIEKTANANLYDVYLRLYQLKIEFESQKPKKP